MFKDCPHAGFDFPRQQGLCDSGGVNSVRLHQSRIAGRDAVQKPGQVMDIELGRDVFENLLEAGVISSTEIWRHTHSDQQYRGRMLRGELYHLPQVVGALTEAEPAQAVVAAQFDNQMGGRMLSQQLRQALQTAVGCFAADTGVSYACLRET